jgi:hypothetical protein
LNLHCPVFLAFVFSLLFSLITKISSAHFGRSQEPRNAGNVAPGVGKDKHKLFDVHWYKKS